MLVSQINTELEKNNELCTKIESRVNVLMDNVKTDRILKKLLQIQTYAGSKLTNNVITSNVKYLLTDENTNFHNINYVSLYKAFNKSSILNKIDSIENLFENATELITANLSHMFNESSKLEYIGSLENLFKNCKNLCSANLEYMFKSCLKLQINTHNIYLKNLFEGCSNLTSVNFHKMFDSCVELQRVDSTRDMFLGCNNLKYIDFSYMFANNKKLEEISLANIFNGIPDDQKIKINTEYMFNQGSKNIHGLVVYLDYDFDDDDPTIMRHIGPDEFHISKHLYPIIRALPDGSMICVETNNYDKVKEWVTELGEIEIEFIEYSERFFRKKSNKKQIFIKGFETDIGPRYYKYWLH